MKKDFIVSKIEATQEGGQYVFITFTDPNEPRSSGGGTGGGSSYPQSPFGKSGEALPFISPEDIMKNLPKVMSNMLGAGGGISGGTPTFKITMKEYKDTAIKVGDKVGIELIK
ncbi:MAG: hypothetical protein M3297_12705 [Thermoproteota archaeon]|jgi:hypothetical protein|nr:hypothetical protein [Thermoproteota archaeon]